MGDCSCLEYPETMKKITITLALLLANGYLGIAEANGTEVPAEVREAFKSWKMPEVEAFKAVEKAVAHAGKTLEGMVPVPDLTIDLKDRRLSKHLVGSKLGAAGRFDLQADYSFGGQPLAKVAMRRHGATLNASYAANGNMQTAVSLPVGKRQTLNYTLSRAAQTNHRASWNFNLAF